MNHPKARQTYGMATSVFGHRAALTPAKIALLADTGLEWIEISALQEQHLNLWDEERICELERALARSPLRVWSVHAPFCAIAMDDEDSRVDGVRQLVRSGLVAERLGAKLVVVHPGRDVPSRQRERELSWLNDNVLRVLERMPSSVAIALETMVSEHPAGIAIEMLTMLQALPADRVGVCVDTGHVHLRTDVVTCINALAGRIATVHLQDNHGRHDDHVLPGSGTINWSGTLAALRAAGYHGAWMAEGADATCSPRENAREFVRRMRSCTGETCGSGQG